MRGLSLNGPPRVSFRRLSCCLVFVAATLAGCSMGSAQKLSVYQREGFSNTEAYARLFDASAASGIREITSSDVPSVPSQRNLLCSASG